MQPQFNFTHITSHVQLDDIGSFINGVVDEILESNSEILLKSIKPDLEKYIGEIIKSIAKPIFDNYALEEFSDGQSVLETYPKTSNSNSRNSRKRSSSNRSSFVVEKMTSSALIWRMLLFALIFKYN